MVEDRSAEQRLDAVRAQLEALVAWRRRGQLSDDEDKRYLELGSEELGLLARRRATAQRGG